MEATSRTLSTYQERYNELSRHIALTPPTATVKGMFVDSFLKSLEREGLERPTKQRYISFKDYPLPEMMRMMLDATATLYPSLPPKEALRRIGRLAYPTLTDSTVGKIVFAIAGRDFKAALPLSSKAYEISLSPGNASISKLANNSAVLVLRDVWNFADSYQAGVFEGAMESFRVQGTVEIVPKVRLCDVDLILKWK